MPSNPTSPNPAVQAPLLNETALFRLPWWQRFDFRVATVFGGAALVIIGICGLFTYQSIAAAKLSAFESRLQSLAVALSQTIDAEDIVHASPDPAVFTPAIQSMRDHFKQIVDSEPDIDSIYILLPTEKPGQLRFLIDASKVSRVAKKYELYDATELPFMLQGFEHVSVEDRVYGDDFGQTQSSYAPLRRKDGTVVGIVGIDVLAIRLNATRWQVIRFCLIVFGVAAAAIFLLAAFVRHQVQQPLARVLHAVSDIASGRPHQQLHTRRHDEFGLLADQFDAMAQHLRDRERLRETFGIYVSRELADSLMKGGKLPELGGVECLATVIFCDLTNYTRISENLGATEVIALINEYLATMSAIVEAHQGCLLDFTGNGIIAAFGTPLALPDHANHAVQCALKMRQQLNRLNGEWEARGLAARWQEVGIDRVEMRIGIHTGPLVAGNIGCASRMKYCVMGDTVNVAARLETLNKEFSTSILVSDQVKVRLPNELLDGLTDRGVLKVRGRLQSVGAYSL
ncbi:MAG TPA: adenylate/guanylate cyclase domain-containing protein [Rariglobus sp.]|jgi:adenylate cyclase|nr:adenylate/guanylate cyclase domain-containing protein [Rariglobus sp.]